MKKLMNALMLALLGWSMMAEPVMAKSTLPLPITRGPAALSTPALPVNTAGYFFASSRLRGPQSYGPAAVGCEYRIDVAEFWSPPYATNNFRIALPAYVTDNSAAATNTYGHTAEIDAPNPFVIDGVELEASNSGWQMVAATFGGNATPTNSPGIGMLSDDVHFTSNVPANTHMQVRIASHVAQPNTSITAITTSGDTHINVTSNTGAAMFVGEVVNGTGIPTNAMIVAGPSGGGTGIYTMSSAATASGTGVAVTGQSQMVGGLVPTQATGHVEAAICGSTSFAGSLASSTKPTGTDGRVLGSVMYSPAFVVAKAIGGLSHDVILHNGDSKTWGKNENENYLNTTYLQQGFVGRAFDDDTVSTRTSYYILSIPGEGMPEQTITSSPDDASLGWSRKLGLIRLVPNRPYTMITTDHYNNGGLDVNYRASFQTYYRLLSTISTAWGNAPVPIYQFRVIPRAGSTNWCTTLAGQSPNTDSIANNGYRWQFDADLVSGFFSPFLAGVIPTNDNYAYDQSTNRDRVKVESGSYTLAADATSASSSISLTTSPPVDTTLVYNATSSSGGTRVRSVTGTGPYTVSIYPNLTTALTTGTVIVPSYCGDIIGLHPSPDGHNLIGGPGSPVITWKNAHISAGYDLPANDVEQKAAA